MSKTASLKQSEIDRSWYLVDASTAPLGRLATEIAQLLIGKGKATFTPHIDNGDYVVVINSDNLVTTGRKQAQKTYYRHSGYMGGIKESTLEKEMEKDSTRVIERAVKGMLPKNKLQTARLKRLKVYAGADHEHTAQNPKQLTNDKEKS